MMNGCAFAHSTAYLQLLLELVVGEFGLVHPQAEVNLCGWVSVVVAITCGSRDRRTSADKSEVDDGEDERNKNRPVLATHELHQTSSSE